MHGFEGYGERGGMRLRGTPATGWAQPHAGWEVPAGEAHLAGGRSLETMALAHDGSRADLLSLAAR
jgi:hypothetical protein